MYKCNDCLKEFKYNYLLKRHNNNKHKCISISNIIEKSNNINNSKINKNEEYEFARSSWASGAFENMLKDLPSNIFDNTKPNLRIVVSDVRFLHEAKKIKEMGGILIKIDINKKNVTGFQLVILFSNFIH